MFQPRIYYWKDRTDLITLTHPIFSLLRDKFYQPELKQKSLVPLELLNILDLFGLMIWFLDDGNYRKHSYSLTISAMGWELEGLTNLSKLINSKFDLSTYVYLCKHKNGQNKTLKFPSKDRFIIEKWKKLAINTNLPECMCYKLEGE